jgi:FdhD protein
LEETIEPPALPESLDSDVLRAGGFAAAVVSPKGFFLAEDVGQSAAIDKAVGSAILSGVDLKKSALMLSGKVTADMVKKALNAGISVIASGYPATNLAAETAAAGNVKLVLL